MDELTPEPDLATTVCRRDQLLYAPITPDEGVMLSLADGRHFGLDAVGCRVWELLETPRTVGQLCAAVVEEFDAEPAQCQSDLLAFVAELAAEGIVDLRPAQDEGP